MSSNSVTAHEIDLIIIIIIVTIIIMTKIIIKWGGNKTTHVRALWFSGKTKSRKVSFSAHVIHT